MDRPVFSGIDGASVIDWLAEQIEDATERFLAHGDRQGLAGIDYFAAPDQSIGGAQGYTADAIAAQVLLNFAREPDVHALVLRIDLASVVDLGKVTFLKLRIER